MNKNIFTILFLICMFAAGAYALKLYSDLQQARQKLANEEQALKKLNDDLSFIQKKLEISLKSNDSLLQEIKRKSRDTSVQNIIKSSEASRKEKAIQYEKEGYESLTKNDFDSALIKFKLAEAAMPGFHAAYEISGMLNKEKLNLNDPSTQKAIKQNIVDKYWGTVPPAQLKTLKQQAKE